MNRAISTALIASLVVMPISALAAEADQQIRAADPAAISAVAESIILSAEIEMIGAKGASQVSQLADQAQLKLAKIQIRQNEEIIKLLRRMVDKK